MTTTEKLFVQIWETRKRIIEQVKHQTQLYDQYLASKCLLDGIAPPSWLFSSSFSSHPYELKKDELISGLLLPQSGYHLNRQNHIVPTADDKDLPTTSYVEARASSSGMDGGDKLSMLPPVPNDENTQCSVDRVAELESPPDCGNARVFDDFIDHSQSLVKIQRSKSRQRALRLRNSVEAKSRLGKEKKDGDRCNSRELEHGINALQYDHVDKKNDDGDGCGHCTSDILESGINSLQCHHIDEQKLVKSMDIHDGGSDEEQGKFGECENRERDTDVCNGRTTSIRRSIQRTSRVYEPGNDGNSYVSKEDGPNCAEDSTELPNHFNKTFKPVDCSLFASATSASEEANMIDYGANEMNDNACSDRITRSRSAISRTSILRDALEGGNSSYIAKEYKEILHKSSEKQPSSVSGLLELVKSSSVVSNDNYRSKAAKSKDKQIKEKGSNTKTSRSSSQQSNPVDKCFHQDNFCVNDEELKQLSQGVHDLTELVKPLDIACEISEEKVKLDECLNIDAGIDAYNNSRTTSSSSIEKIYKVNDFLKMDDSIDIIMDKDGMVAQSFSKSSLPRKLTSSEQRAEVNPQVLSSTRQNVLPYTESTRPETNIDGNGLVEVHPFACAGHRVEVLEPRYPSECTVPVKPKQLDFDDMESSLLEACNPSLENKQDDIEKQLSNFLPPIDVLQEETSVGNPEKTSLSIKMPVLKEQEFSRKSSKSSSECHIKGGVGMLDDSTVKQNVVPFISQNRKADTELVDSWPQHKRIKKGSQAANALSAPPSLKIVPNEPMHTRNKGDSLQLDIVQSPVEGMHRSLELQKVEECEVLSCKLEVDQVEISMERMGRIAGTKHNAEENHVLFQYEGALKLEDVGILNCTEDTMQEKSYHIEGKGKLSYSSSGSPLIQSVIGEEQSMPEFEGFVMGTDDEHLHTTDEQINFDNLNLPPAELGCASALERLCKSTSLRTPLSHFSATYDLQEALNLYHSMPNGLLEEIELRSTLDTKNEDSKQLGADYSFLDVLTDDAIHEKSHPISFPISYAQSAWDITKPSTTPVGKFWDGMPLKSGSSGKRVSSIPELPCISEENETADGIGDTLLGGMVEPLADITNNSNALASVFEAEMHDRGSIASMNTEVSFSGTCDRAKMKLRNKSNNKGCINEDKENHDVSLAGDDVKRGNGSLHIRFSRPKLSGKASLRKGLGLSEKDSKLHNIVSNVTSFIPLVKQKQDAAIVTGKRSVKVKALEAAEAAKRNAEKKENERKMRKEAMKHERVKMEEQNIRQLEMEKKKKEEEKKKKEADMAAKKRQREEEERKEKERKRMRVEEAKRHQLAQDKKLHAQKEGKEDEKAHERKESKARLARHEKIEKAKGDNNIRTVTQNESLTTKVSNDSINASVIPKDCNALSVCGDVLKVIEGSVIKTSKSDSLISNITQEQSYEISPYKGSDDEDEDEDDDVQNSKFIPSWASKSRLTLVVSSQQRIDPESIFPPESFVSIAEVLLPRRLQQK